MVPPSPCLGWLVAGHTVLASVDVALRPLPHRAARRRHSHHRQVRRMDCCCCSDASHQTVRLMLGGVTAGPGDRPITPPILARDSGARSTECGPRCRARPSQSVREARAGPCPAPLPGRPRVVHASRGSSGRKPASSTSAADRDAGPSRRDWCNPAPSTLPSLGPTPPTRAGATEGQPRLRSHAHQAIRDNPAISSSQRTHRLCTADLGGRLPPTTDDPGARTCPADGVTLSRPHGLRHQP